MIGRLCALARRPSCVPTPLARARQQAFPSLLARYSDSASSTTTKPEKPKRTKKRTSTTIAYEDLPAFRPDDDGWKVGPLETALELGAARHDSGFVWENSGRTEAQQDADEEAEYRRAVREGRIPETALARLVWTNWRRFPDCILLTQVGNFYESYFEPAIEVAGLLGIKLTSKTYKSGPYPFTGFPIHQIEKYLKVLVQDLGHTVVLVEEDKDPMNPAPSAADIRRKVARVVTPGTLVDESWLTGHESRYLLAIAIGDPPQKGAEDDARPLYLAYADVSTGEFFTKEASTADIEDEMARIAPREVVLDTSLYDAWRAGRGGAEGPVGDVLDLLRVLGVHVSFADASRSGASPPALEPAAIALLRHHLEYALRDNMPSMPEFNRESAHAQMHIDAATLQALEIRHALRPGGLVGGTSLEPHASPLSVRGTLLSVLSRTVTDSGHRLLKRTLTAPSTDLAAINSRLALVAALHGREALRTDLRTALRSIGDVMRIVQRFRARRGDASDVWDVARWVRSVGRLVDRLRLETAMGSGKGVKSHKNHKDCAQAEGTDRLSELVTAFSDLDSLANAIEAFIDESCLPGAVLEDSEAESDEAEVTLAQRGNAKGPRWWLNPKFSLELTDLHKRLDLLASKRDKLEARLRDEYAAPSLSLTTSTRWGYVVTLKKRDTRLPKDKFHSVGEARSARTYTYSEWSALGARLEEVHAELAVAEARALNRLRMMVVERADTIQHNAELVDEIDLTAGFAQAALDLNYVRPILNEGTELRIVDGRHPSVEAALLAQTRTFTPNTTEMDAGSHLHVITGPNQGGKSTLLRQTAVIAILAQAGSYVPAASAEVGIVDRVFSRVGARDDLFRDRSTFMLEMVETSAILRHATPRSLVIMDEIGRGTTLNAGMAIAYATLDYILTHIGCRTLFATHYHELAQMLGASTDGAGTTRAGVSFWCTDIDEMGDTFAYAYRLRRGINYNSHALRAAQLAGMPPSFLETAGRVLADLENAQ